MVAQNPNPNASEVLVFGDAPEAFFSQFEKNTGFAPCHAPDVSALREYARQAGPTAICAFKPANGQFPTEEIQAIQSLKWLHIASAGIDHLVSWRRQDVVVTNSSGVHSRVLAEYVLCEILKHGLSSRAFDEQQRRAEWGPHELSSCAGKSVCIVGYGSVGSTTGDILAKVGMNVLAVTRSGRGSEGSHARFFPISELRSAVKNADFVVVTVPLTDASRGLIGRSEFDAMKPGAYFINIARGGIVDEQALCDALTAGQLTGATSDVFSQEPLPKESAMWRQPNLYVTPHTGDQEGWEGLVADLFTQNLQWYRTGETLKNIVDPSRGY